MATTFEVYRHKYVPQLGIDEHVDTGIRVVANGKDELYAKVDAIAHQHGVDNAEGWFYPRMTVKKVGK